MKNMLFETDLSNINYPSCAVNGRPPIPRHSPSAPNVKVDNVKHFVSPPRTSTSLVMDKCVVEDPVSCLGLTDPNTGLFARVGTRQVRDQKNSYGAFILKLRTKRDYVPQDKCANRVWSS